MIVNRDSDAIVNVFSCRIGMGVHDASEYASFHYESLDGLIRHQIPTRFDWSIQRTVGLRWSVLHFTTGFCDLHLDHRFQDRTHDDVVVVGTC